MMVTAIGQAMLASLWWLIVPKKPPSSFLVLGIVLLAMRSAPARWGLIPCR
jgi:hypothetical protein